MSKIKLYFFQKKLAKWPCESTLDEIIAKILLIAYTLKINGCFKFINKNKICLYDCCLFIAFIVRKIYFNKSYISVTKRQEFDDELLVKLIVGFDFFFKCPQITSANINISRFDFYDEVMDNHCYESDKISFEAGFDVFKNIIKNDIINRKFEIINSNSPLYLLNSFENNTLCELESKYALETALTSFGSEIEKL